MDEKAKPAVTVDVHEVSDAFGHSTANDQRDMRRMGKKQEFVRSFHIVTSIAFTSCVMGTWELLLATSSPALIAGGTSGLFWSCVWGYIGQSFIVLSLAEMSSMAPTAGGQYHWVSEFAPPRYQKIWSYTSGWLSTLCWQSFTTVSCFLCGEMVQSMIILNSPSYVPQQWHLTLLTIAFVVGISLFNIFAARWLAILEGMFAFLHYIVFIPFVAALWALAPVKQDGTVALMTFQDNGTGWNNPGIAVLIGQVTAFFTLVGSDAAAHMAEEIREAGVVVPRSMWWSFIANVPPTLIVLVTYCFCIGDIAATLSGPTTLPIVNLFSMITPSPAGATGLTFVLFILIVFVTISCQASTSRQTFAFARDNGLPLKRYLGAVHPRHQAPVNAIVLSIFYTLILSLINIGSTTAFNAFLSVGTVALMATYGISIFCVLLKRLRGEPLVHARWSLFRPSVGEEARGGGLGRYGVLVNGVALLYALWAFFWGFWPPVRDVTTDTMNWAVVIFVAVMLLAAATYALHAKNVYDGPVAQVVVLDGDSDGSSSDGAEKSIDFRGQDVTSEAL